MVTIHQANSSQHPGYLEAAAAYTSATNEYAKFLERSKKAANSQDTVMEALLKRKVDETGAVLQKLNEQYFR